MHDLSAIKNLSLLTLIRSALRSIRFYLFPIAAVLLGIFIAAELVRDNTLSKQSSFLTATASSYLRWDATHYKDIAERGYQCVPKPTLKRTQVRNTTVWYPLYPLLARITSDVTSLPIEQTLLLVAWTSLLLGSSLLYTFMAKIKARELFLAHDWTREQSLKASQYTLAFMLFGPASVFLYASYTEALFILLSMLVIYCAHYKQWFWGALIAGIATASRSQGTILAAFLILTFLRECQLPLMKRLAVASILAPLSVFGIVSYLSYLYSTFGNWHCFLDGQYMWNMRISPETIAMAINPLHTIQVLRMSLISHYLTFPLAYEPVCAVVAPLVLLYARNLLGYSFTLLGLAFWILPFFSGADSGWIAPGIQPWMSMGRFMQANIPLQVAFGVLSVKHPRTMLLLLLVSTQMFIIFAINFRELVWVG